MKTRIGRILLALVFVGTSLHLAVGQIAAGQSSGADETTAISPVDTDQDSSSPDETSPTDSTSAAPATGPVRSYLSSAVHASQGIDSNPGNLFTTSSHIAAVTDLYGSANLFRVGRNSQTAVDYLAGTTFYEGNRQAFGYDNQRNQVLDIEQRFTWSKTQLTVRDSLRNLRLSGFGSAPLTTTGAYILRFAQMAATTPLEPAVADFLGSPQAGSPDQLSSVINLVDVDVTRALSRRTSVFASGAYSFTDYFGKGRGLVDDHQLSAQLGYKDQLNRKEQIGFVYGYQSIRFPEAGSGSVVTNSVQLLYTRRISTRLSISAGGGPEFAVVHNQLGRIQQLNSTARAEVSYRLRNTNLGLSYSRVVTAGNGVFAGANSNVFRFSADRRLFRSWQASLTGGYSTVSRLTRSGTTPIGGQGNSYQYAFVGAAVQRPLGQHLSAFVNYRFDNQNLGELVCGSSAACSPGLQQRHVAAVGFDWNMRPLRLQ